jgi:hypothetical protein
MLRFKFMLASLSVVCALLGIIWEASAFSVSSTESSYNYVLGNASLWHSEVSSSCLCTCANRNSLNDAGMLSAGYLL